LGAGSGLLQLKSGAKAEEPRVGAELGARNPKVGAELLPKKSGAAPKEERSRSRLPTTLLQLSQKPGAGSQELKNREVPCSKLFLLMNERVQNSQKINFTRNDD